MSTAMSPNFEPTPWERDQAEVVGIRYDEPMEAYHASPGLSNGGLKNFAITPAHFISRKGSDEETSAQRLGTLAHMAVLEPVRFLERARAVAGHRGGAAVKREIELLEGQGYYVCKPDELEDAKKMRDAVYNHPEASRLLSGGRPEVSIRWRDPEFGYLQRCRPDYLRDDGIVSDVKTFANLTDRNIRSQIERMMYHWQSRHYLNGVNSQLGLVDNKMFAHIFIDTEIYSVRVVILGDASLDKAEEEMREHREMYANCLRANVWPAYPAGISNLELPDWKFL